MAYILILFGFKFIYIFITENVYNQSGLLIKNILLYKMLKKICRYVLKLELKIKKIHRMSQLRIIFLFLSRF